MKDPAGIYATSEGARLLTVPKQEGHWNRWGPFVSERSWGTVREDYSDDGDAWSSFPHDHARSRAYRWNEDGLAGICDRHQYLCFALALWNGRDPFLKERLFGLAGPEGNHGEDVKEYYFYLDNTPTHSYMKYLYKYPQAEYPYSQLVRENGRRNREEREYELVDTGIFDESRYFDVLVEYAKVTAEHLLIRIQISNRGPDPAPIHVLPTLWFRNTWRWGRDARVPSLTPSAADRILARHWQLGDYVFSCPAADELLFTDNETNTRRLYDSPPSTPYVKDAFHEYVVGGQKAAVNPKRRGTKSAALYARTVGPGETVTLDLQLARASDPLTPDFEAELQKRRNEADEFYQAVMPGAISPEARLVARQALAGMLWSKQSYHYVVTDWLEGDPDEPAPPPQRWEGRNSEWTHLFTRDVISMPDKWEFPWFASWDLGFHCTTLAHVDPPLAKEQILLILREWFMHPNGQIPACEWDFSDVNPPVIMLAARRVFELEQLTTGVSDYDFLERVFQKLLLNFTWWVNRKDATGKNIFQGGFLGMDNIGAFDRDRLPAGYEIGQADGTSWMAAFAKSMLYTALLLAEKNPSYEDLASKFWEHFIYIANAMNSQDDPERSLWHEKDGFFYDHLTSPKGGRIPVRARTMVGFTPLFGAFTVPADTFARYPGFQRRRQWFLDHRPNLIANLGPTVKPGANNTLLVGLVRPDQLRRMLAYMLDEDEFLSPYGVRAVSRYHLEHPLVLNLGGQEYRLDYEPGESTSDLFGGNSNWRGPVWLPVNMLILFSLKQYYDYFGDTFKVDCPTGSGHKMDLLQVIRELERRLSRLFLRDEHKKRAVFGDCELFNRDPNWSDLIPFHEYFHGDTGRGCGASHQTGWTGSIATILMNLARSTDSRPEAAPPRASRPRPRVSSR